MRSFYKYEVYFFNSSGYGMYFHESTIYLLEETIKASKNREA